MYRIVFLHINFLITMDCIQVFVAQKIISVDLPWWNMIPQNFSHSPRIATIALEYIITHTLLNRNA